MLHNYLREVKQAKKICYVCAHGREGQAQHLFSWRRISQGEIRNSAAAESEGGAGIPFPRTPFPARPARAVGFSVPQARHHQVFFWKWVRAKFRIEHYYKKRRL